MKKLWALLIMVGAVALSGCGSNISQEEALKLVLDDAGVKKEDITITKEAQSDDGFEFEFYTTDASYQYEVDEDGTIEEREIKHHPSQSTNKENVNQQTNENSNSTVMTKEEALVKAYAHFGVDEANATLVEVKEDYENNVKVYDIEFIAGGKEYSIEINMQTGEVVSYDVDVQ